MCTALSQLCKEKYFIGKNETNYKQNFNQQCDPETSFF